MNSHRQNTNRMDFFLFCLPVAFWYGAQRVRVVRCAWTLVSFQCVFIGCAVARPAGSTAAYRHRICLINRNVAYLKKRNKTIQYRQRCNFKLVSRMKSFLRAFHSRRFFFLFLPPTAKHVVYAHLREFRKFSKVSKVTINTRMECQSAKSDRFTRSVNDSSRIAAISWAM